MKILRHASFLLAFWIIVTPAWAADDAAIEGLQSDANVTKNKADQNAQDINSLKNGLPAVEARVAALEAALDGAGGTIGKLQADLTAAKGWGVTGHYHEYAYGPKLDGDGNLWITDPRDEGSPYGSAFCHVNELADDVSQEDLLHRETIVEFYLKESEQKDDGLIATNVRMVQPVGR